MGQYYRPYLKGERDVVTLVSWDYDNGAKLMEHSWLGNEFINAVLFLLFDEKRKVGWIGDYSLDAGCNPEIYEVCWGDNAQKSLIVTPPQYFADDDGIVGEGYLINHTKKEYIDYKEYQKLAERNGWCVNPLPLLTAIGNGLGGGDYYKKNVNADLVGYWYLDELEFSINLHPPKGYANMTEHYIFID